MTLVNQTNTANIALIENFAIEISGLARNQGVKKPAVGQAFLI